MHLNLFLDILGIESTSGSEHALAKWLETNLTDNRCRVTRVPADAPACKPYNLLFEWGVPRVVFCTHLDTVPPYIPPTVEKDADGDIVIKGRGSCDAKGQIFAMYTACTRLADAGRSGFGLLLLHGEETGSFGAKEYNALCSANTQKDTSACSADAQADTYLVVGEPTDNMMVSASKGTKAFEVRIHGKKCHSGYPANGISAVDRFVDLANLLRSARFPVDPVLGDTSWNVGKLVSDNPQNILSDLLTCRIYFRTTFASDTFVTNLMNNIGIEGVEIKALGGDTPLRYFTLPGFDTKPVAFGSDAPHLTCFDHRMICGPGSILTAHTPYEYIKLKDIETAIDNYKRIAETLLH